MSSPLPFWSWNDRLAAAELARQVRLMKEQSLGGFVIHARGGLRTEYLSPEWMACVRRAVDEAARLGMEAWIYDENGWPSGSASGQVPGLGEQFQQKVLRFGLWPGERLRHVDRVLGVYDRLTGAPKRLDELVPGETCAACSYELNPHYADLLDARVTDAFLHFTHDRYRERLGEECWRTLAGFFTDEPQLARDGIPWSPVLATEYELAYGEGLVPLLPQLFAEVGEYRRTRYRFWRLVTVLFSRNFFERVYRWCERYGVKITGHLVCEDGLRRQLTANGAVMPHYEYFHLPGIDWLGRGLGPVTAVRQVASAAAQVGRAEVLSESFALCGWGIRFEELKRIFQWQMVQGVTRLCPHLQAYSLRGMRKRDYPPSLFYQQPWWPDWHVLAEHLSRIGRLLASSESTTRVAIIHPQGSAWVNFNGNDHRRIDEIDSFFRGLSEALDAAGVEYHYADEILMERHGRVAGGELRIGRQAYACVVVPLVDSLAAATVRLLAEFAASGGSLLAFDSGPILVAGARDAAAGRLLEKASRFRDVPSLVGRLAPYAIPMEVMPSALADTPATSVMATRRRIADFHGGPAVVYFVVNNDPHRERQIILRTGHGRVARYDPDRDILEPSAGSQPSEVGGARFLLQPGGDLVVAVFPLGGAASAEPAPAREGTDVAPGRRRTVPVAPLGGRFDLESSTENILLLDRCGFTVDGEEPVVEESVTVVHDRLLSLRRPVDLLLTFSFAIDETPRSDESLCLLMEDPLAFEVRVNGRRPGAPRGWLFDASFERIPIGKMVESGSNVITLRTRYHQAPRIYEAVEQARGFEGVRNRLAFDSEIEAVYLAGDFDVRTPGTFTPLERNAVRYHGTFHLAARSRHVTIESLHASGFPFFAGRLIASTKVRLSPSPEARYCLECDRIDCNSVGVSMNGVDAGTLCWRPYRLDISGLLVEGENTIALHLTTSLRNMLGPHHRAAGESHFVGPFSFFKEDGVFARTWEGTMEEWTDDYCFSRFGIQGVRISRETVAP